MPSPYRAARPVPDDEPPDHVLWGPLHTTGRNVGIALFMSLFIVFGFAVSGWSDGIECSRARGEPGTCDVLTLWHGMRVFGSPLPLDRVAGFHFEQITTHPANRPYSQTNHYGLVEALDRGGGELEVWDTGVPAAERAQAKLSDFLRERTRLHLLLRAKPLHSWWWLPILMVGIAAMWWYRLARPSRMALRVDLDADEMTVEERLLGMRLRRRTISLEGVNEVQVEEEPYTVSSARLVLRGPDIKPRRLTVDFFPGDEVHEKAAAALRHALELDEEEDDPPPPARS